jgi:hypothetical protein
VRNDAGQVAFSRQLSAVSESDGQRKRLTNRFIDLAES